IEIIADDLAAVVDRSGKRADRARCIKRRDGRTDPNKAVRAGSVGIASGQLTGLVYTLDDRYGLIRTIQRRDLSVDIDRAVHLHVRTDCIPCEGPGIADRLDKYPGGTKHVDDQRR